MGMYDFSCEVDASVIENNADNVLIRVTCYWRNSAWTYNMQPVYAWVTCNGEERQVLGGDWINTKSDQYGRFSLGSSDFRIAKTHSGWSCGCSARLRSDSTYVSGARSSGTTYPWVDARNSYTLKYDANGGSGAPGNQTKWHNETLYISNTVPTKTGASFKRWNTSTGDNGEAYSPGGAFTNNWNTTVYAIWTTTNYTITYNANGGSLGSVPSTQSKPHGSTVYITSYSPTRSGYVFMGWATSSNGSVSYSSGSAYTSNANITLYAVWRVAYTPPRITNFTVHRCTSTGTRSDTGQYLRFACKWETDNTVTAVRCQWQNTDLSLSSSWSYYTCSASNKSGSVDQIVGTNQVYVENSYRCRMYVSDGSGQDSYSDIIIVGTQAFPIDVKALGKGIAFGKAADTDNLFDVNFPVNFRDPSFTYNGRSLKNTILDWIYPVGSIYISSNDIPPDILFGGSWSQIPGRMLVGTGRVEANTTDYWGVIPSNDYNNFPLGEKGGVYHHRLSTNEVPHLGSGVSYGGTGIAGGSGWSDTWIGGGDPPDWHNNMPPYYAVSMWKREKSVGTWDVLPYGSGAYAFVLNNDGFYESTNQNINNSYSMCRIRIVATQSCKCKITYICYAENDYDFGIFSNLDYNLSQDLNADSTGVFKSTKGESSKDEKTITYNVSTGEHYICVKYRKDGSQSENYDSLQFRVSLTS